MKQREFPVFQNADTLSRREEIKARLRSCGTNMSKIADRLGVAPSTVQAVVCGRSFSLKIAQEIASALDLKVSEIWPDKVQSEDQK